MKSKHSSPAVSHSTPISTGRHALLKSERGIAPTFLSHTLSLNTFFNLLYASFSPPFLKLNRTSSCLSTPDKLAPAGTDTGVGVGRFLVPSNGVEQISQNGNVGWLRNVQAGQDIRPSVFDITGVEGIDDDFEARVAPGVGPGVVVRDVSADGLVLDAEYATPHKPHLESGPGELYIGSRGLTKPHTPQVQFSSVRCVVGAVEEEEVGVWPRDRVILGDERMNPV